MHNGLSIYQIKRPRFLPYHI